MVARGNPNYFITYGNGKSGGDQARTPFNSTGNNAHPLLTSIGPPPHTHTHTSRLCSGACSAWHAPQWRTPVALVCQDTQVSAQEGGAYTGWAPILNQLQTATRTRPPPPSTHWLKPLIPALVPAEPLGKSACLCDSLFWYAGSGAVTRRLCCTSRTTGSGTAMGVAMQVLLPPTHGGVATVKAAVATASWWHRTLLSKYCQRPLAVI